MKKVFALVLVVLLVFGMATHAFALEESHAEWERLLPVLSEDSSGIAIFYNVKDVQELSEEDQKLMEEANATLDEARPAHLALKYFCMVEILSPENAATIVFDPIEHDEIQFKQHIGGVWTVLDHTVNEDGTIVVSGIVDAPLAIFTNHVDNSSDNKSGSGGKRDSVSAQRENLLPDLSKGTPVTVLLHSTEMVPHLSEEIQNLMAEAKAKLKDACPQGCAAKFFCYVEIIGDRDSATVVFEKIEFNEIHFNQYVDGEWVELSYVINEDGTITVDNVVEGPMVIFIK